MFAILYKLLCNLYNGTSGKPSPTEMFISFITMVLLVKFDCHSGHGTPCPYDCNTYVSCIAVGDGILDVPKCFRYINIKSANKLFHTTRTINSEFRIELTCVPVPTVLFLCSCKAHQRPLCSCILKS